jgi:hypothetical protein
MAWGFGWRCAAGLLLAASMGLSGCGGGGDDGSGAPGQGTSPVATVQGQVLDSQDGQPVAGATVSVQSASAQTDAQGRFTLPLNTGDLAVKAEKSGYSAGVAAAAGLSGDHAELRVWVQRLGSTQTVDTASAAVLTVPGSAARVSLPANGLADAQTGAAFTGNAEARVTPIDPAARPESMPGSYQARSADGSSTAIESFGALHVELRDPASGRALNLAQGQTATIRIPLASRNLNPPATLPLYHLDESTGVWIEEGTATLAGSGADAYYEGTVSHFSYWNADQPADTVYIDGCVRNADGSTPAWANVITTGVDYSGSGWAASNAQGNFHVAVRRGGRAVLIARVGATGSDPLAVGPLQADTQLSECLVLRDTSGLVPSIVRQPLSNSALVGSAFFVDVLASPDTGLQYQWRRNGVDIAGANAPLLRWFAQPGDNGAVFTVVVGNAQGSVTSQPATLTVTGGGSGGGSSGQEEQLLRLVYVGLSGWELALAPSNVVDDTVAQLVAPSAVCSTGSLSQALYDGTAISGGEALTANVQHTLDVSFAQCDVDGDTLNGRGVAQFSYSQSNGSLHLQGTSTVTNLSSSGAKLTGNGSYAFDLVSNPAQNTSQGTMTPSAGATLLSQVSGLTARIEGGSMGWNFQGTGNGSSATLSANNLAFTVDGTAFVSSGQITTTFGTSTSGSGELRLTSGGTPVGRVFYQNGVLKIEVNGQVKPFSAGQLPAPARR